MKGIAIAEGYAIGTLHVIETVSLSFDKRSKLTEDAECMSFRQSINRIKDRLIQDMAKAQSLKDDARADIFSAHHMILDDPELSHEIEQTIIKENVTAAYAVSSVTDRYIALFEGMDNPYMRERSHDIRDLREQLLKDLLGVTNDVSIGSSENVILAARDFNPSDIQYTENNGVLGFLSEKGAATTHFAILAKIAGLPTVLGIDHLLTQVKTGDQVIVDGDKGEVILNPDEVQLEYYRQLIEARKAFNEDLKLLAAHDTITTDGHAVEVYANIANVKDAEKAKANGAEGVGLFRTEFIYMDRSTPPTEEEQYQIYKSVLEIMEDKPVVIRTLDVGGDKALPYLNIPKEDNPFLGFRAVRYCLVDKPLFRVQLRALLRASVHGNLHMMIPMISCIEEVLEVKGILAELEDQLRLEQIPFNPHYELGIMIEIPSAALCAEILAEEVDFFSIGTNDLIQYTFAVDRMNSQVAHLYNPYQHSFLRLLKMIIDGAHSKGIKVAMCGELASEKDFIPLLIGMGLDEFSVNTGAVLKTRRAIRDSCYRDAVTMIEEALCQKSSVALKESLNK